VTDFCHAAKPAIRSADETRNLPTTPKCKYGGWLEPKSGDHPEFKTQMVWNVMTIPSCNCYPSLIGAFFWVVLMIKRLDPFLLVYYYIAVNYCELVDFKKDKIQLFGDNNEE
jgi:hypothetical protein